MTQMAALGGIRILDFSHALAGPYCTLLLSDYGASVYKIESPGGGDMGRGWGPPFAGDTAHFFVGMNRGKYGISIDLKKPEGLNLCLALVAKMDVLVENFRPGTMDRLGLGYKALSASNPRLIYCSISGYGQNGPSRDEAAMDLVVECSSGFLSITGTEEGSLVRSGYAVADINAGLFATIGILTALRAREQTGRGQYVDVSMLDGMISAMSSSYMYYLGSGKIPGPLGTAFATVVPYEVFEAKDRPFSIAVGSEKLWSVFCRAIGRPELEKHPDFATNSDRVRNRHELEETLRSVFRERGVEEWVTTLRGAGIPCSPVRNLEEVVNHPQTSTRDMFPEIEYPSGVRQRVIGPPVKLSETPPRVGEPPPAPGQHNAEVLRDVLGMTDIQIAELVRQGIIFRPERMTVAD